MILYTFKHDVLRVLLHSRYVFSCMVATSREETRTNLTACCVCLFFMTACNRQVTFEPDFRRLGLPEDGFTPDDHALLCRRVADIAGTVGEGVSVWLDGKKLKAQTFADYVRLFPGVSSSSPSVVVVGRNGPRWECVRSFSTFFRIFHFSIVFRNYCGIQV